MSVLRGLKELQFFHDTVLSHLNQCNVLLNRMLESILYTTAFCGLFMVLDRMIATEKWLSPYYAVHALHNAVIVLSTAPDVYHTFTDIHGLDKYPTNYLAVQLCIALHLYHILLYWNKFRYDDWLHHGLMIGLAMPLSLTIEAHTLMGFSLFFTTGLPGGLDYAMLFLVRNNLLLKNTEKSVNTFLNVWIRSPGCAAMAALAIAARLSQPTDLLTTLLTIGPPLLTFWNGQYFMQQVVVDSARLGV